MLCFQPLPELRPESERLAAPNRNSNWTAVSLQLVASCADDGLLEQDWHRSYSSEVTILVVPGQRLSLGLALEIVRHMDGPPAQRIVLTGGYEGL
jgi:hypothetical protein